jgi:hypothetical protein
VLNHPKRRFHVEAHHFERCSFAETTEALYGRVAHTIVPIFIPEGAPSKLRVGEGFAG